jgi:uncharacterized protein YtpQ (UPF0354 family)
LRSNAYRGYRNDPGRLQSLVKNFAATLARPARASSTPAVLDRSRIVPVIKDRPWLDELNGRVRAQHGPDAPEMAVDDFNKELIIIYAADDANRTRYLMAKEVAGIDRAELRALALANLKRILPKIELRGDNGLYTITAGGDYEASLLLFDDIWSGDQIKVKGDIVVAIPARDALLVTGSRNRARLKDMREAAAKLVKGPYHLTPTLFVYRKGRFVKFGRDRELMAGHGRSPDGANEIPRQGCPHRLPYISAHPTWAVR